MVNKKYKKIAEHYNNCFQKHGDSHLGVDWPSYKDTLIRHEIMLGVTQGQSDVSLLDFGCGLGHFYEYLKRNDHINFIEYSGLDINSEMLALCINKYPGVNFIHSDIIQENSELNRNWDYIICNGVFTEKLHLTWDEMFQFMTSTIKKLWKKTNIGLAFNVMSTHLDYERDELFHVDLDVMGDFIFEELGTRNFEIKHGYGGLYEYTVYVYKN